jgi:hypothetical protein
VHYQVQGRKLVLSDETQKTHRDFRTPLWQYARHSRVMVALTAPLIYFCVIPFLLLDIAVSIYQGICFPIYGIPIVQRADYLIFDRGRLLYLNGSRTYQL